MTNETNDNADGHQSVADGDGSAAVATKATANANDGNDQHHDPVIASEEIESSNTSQTKANHEEPAPTILQRDSGDTILTYPRDIRLNSASRLCNTRFEARKVIFQPFTVLHLENYASSPDEVDLQEFRMLAIHKMRHRRRNSVDGGMADADELLEYMEEMHDESEMDGGHSAGRDNVKQKDSGGNAADATVFNQESDGGDQTSPTTDTNPLHVDDGTTSNSGDVGNDSDHASNAESDANSEHPLMLYIIQEGTAGVYHGQQRVRTLHPGDAINEHCFLYKYPHDASIVACAELTCAAVEHQSLFASVDAQTASDLPKAQSADDDVQEEAEAPSQQPSNTIPATLETCLREFCAAPKIASDDSSNSDSAQTGDESEDSSSSTPTDELSDLDMPSVTSTLMKVLDIDDTSKAPRANNNNRARLAFLLSQPDAELDVAFAILQRDGKIHRADMVRLMRQFDGTAAPFLDRHFGATEGDDGILRRQQFDAFFDQLKSELSAQAFWSAAYSQHPTATITTKEAIEMLTRYADGPMHPSVQELLGAYATAMVSSRMEDPALGRIHSSSIPQSQSRLQSQATNIRYGDFLTMRRTMQNLPHWAECIDKTRRWSKDQGRSISAHRLLQACRNDGNRMNRDDARMVVDMFHLDRRNDSWDEFWIPHQQTATTMMPMILSVADANKLTADAADSFTATLPANASADVDSDTSAQVLIGAGGTTATTQRHPLSQLFQMSATFAAAVTAGWLSIVPLYPLDLVKTRMMNQRISPSGSRLYLQSVDCLQKVVRYEGFAGLYKGMLPPLLAIGPELTVMFGVQDLMRGLPLWTERSRSSSLFLEGLTGACAGACQLLVTNPMEIAKIRMQSLGETARLFEAYGIPRSKLKSFSEVAVEAQLSGLYRGAAACLMRDIPFGAIYFPSFVITSEFVAMEPALQTLSPTFQTFVAGFLAGIPASFITTPADVVKTRLQVTPRPGEALYAGLRDCSRAMYVHEGPSSFFKGSVFRTLRVSTQLGVAIAAYESISARFGLPSRVTSAYGGIIDSAERTDTSPRRLDPSFTRLKLREIAHVSKILNLDRDGQ